MFLVTIVFIFIIRIITMLVYTLIKENDFGPSFSNFEFTLILGFTEIIPCFLMIFSFFKFKTRDEDSEALDLGNTNGVQHTDINASNVSK